MDIIMRAIEGGADFISFKERYPQLELDRKRIETDLARDSIENPKLDENQIETFLNAMLQLDSSTDEGRGRLINTFLRRVIVFKEYVGIYLSLRKEPFDVEIPSKKAENTGKPGLYTASVGSPLCLRSNVYVQGDCIVITTDLYSPKIKALAEKLGVKRKGDRQHR